MELRSRRRRASRKENDMRRIAFISVALMLAVVGIIIVGCARDGSLQKYNALRLEKDVVVEQLANAQSAERAAVGGAHAWASSGAEKRITLPPGTALSREEELWVIEKAISPQP